MRRSEPRPAQGAGYVGGPDISTSTSFDACAENVSQHRIKVLIPFLDLKAQYCQIKPEIDAALARVVESAQFVLGPELVAFEKRFAAYCNVG